MTIAVSVTRGHMAQVVSSHVWKHESVVDVRQHVVTLLAELGETNRKYATRPHARVVTCKAL